MQQPSPDTKEFYAAVDRHFQARLEAPDAPEEESDGSRRFGVVGQFKGHDVRAYHNTFAKFYLFDVVGRATHYTIDQRHFQCSGSMEEARADMPEFSEWLASTSAKRKSPDENVEALSNNITTGVTKPEHSGERDMNFNNNSGKRVDEMTDAEFAACIGLQAANDDDAPKVSPSAPVPELAVPEAPAVATKPPEKAPAKTITTAALPTTIFNPGLIPETLKKAKRWSPWSLTKVDGRDKPQKFPHASTKVPDQWLDFDTAISAMGKYASGLGYLMTGEHGVVGIDLDNCIVDGVIDDFAQDIINRAASYTEVSPSGKGVRIFLQGSTPRDYLTKAIEMYAGHSRRFLTVTGQQVPGTPRAVNAAPDLIAHLVQQLGAQALAKVPDTPLPDLVDVGDLSDAGLPPNALAFLVDGTTPAHGDDSRALHAAACALVTRYDDATAMSYLIESRTAWGVASKHWPRSDDDAQHAAAMEYLWRHHILKARVTVEGSGFADLGGDDLADLPDMGTPPSPVKVTVVRRGFSPVEYVIEAFLSAGPTLIAGAHGIGKTSLLVSLACIASGEMPGGDVGTKLPRHVVYFTEDPEQAHRIRAGLEEHCGMVPNGQFHIRQAKRVNAATAQALVAKLVAKLTIAGPCAYPTQPLIVFDTTNACFDVENENDASAVGAIMAALKVGAPGAPMWLVAHLAKTLKRAEVHQLSARGSSAWEADAQTTAFIISDEVDNPDCTVRHMLTQKRRFETGFTELKFETFTGHVDVDTPWGDVQRLGYRYGVPERGSPAARIEANEERKASDSERKKLERIATKASAAVDYITEVINEHGPVAMFRGTGGSRTAPEGEHVLAWSAVTAALDDQYKIANDNDTGAIKKQALGQFDTKDLGGNWTRYSLRTPGEMD